MKTFNFRKTIKRTMFSITFKSAGKRRTIRSFKKWKAGKKKSMLARIRRAHMGFKNKRYGRYSAFKHFIMFGMKKRKPESKFRRFT